MSTFHLPEELKQIWVSNGLPESFLGRLKLEGASDTAVNSSFRISDAAQVFEIHFWSRFKLLTDDFRYRLDYLGCHLRTLLSTDWRRSVSERRRSTCGAFVP